MEPADARSERRSAKTYRKAVAYSRARYRLYFASTAYGIAVLAAAIALHLGPVLRDVATRTTASPWLQTAIYAPVLLGLLAVVSLPEPSILQNASTMALG